MDFNVFLCNMIQDNSMLHIKSETMIEAQRISRNEHLHFNDFIVYYNVQRV